MAKISHMSHTRTVESSLTSTNMYGPRHAHPYAAIAHGTRSTVMPQTTKELQLAMAGVQTQPNTTRSINKHTNLTFLHKCRHSFQMRSELQCTSSYHQHKLAPDADKQNISCSATLPCFGTWIR